DMEVARKDFEDLAAPLGQKILDHRKTSLDQANLSPADVGGVVFAGGGSRVPCACRGIEELFGPDKILRDINLDNAIVLSACRAIGMKLEERHGAWDTSLVVMVAEYPLAG